jgi:sporulation protein YhbH
MILRDQRRFREIVRGKVRKNLRKYITRQEMIGQKGDKLVSIPVPDIQIPRFRFGRRQTGGVGQGKGEKGTPIGFDPNQPTGGDQAGNLPGEHILEVEISLEELAKILGEELELPDIEPRGKKNIVSEVDKYRAIRRVGPESLCHFKRTYKEALKRQIMLGTYSVDDPCIVPVRHDKRYRSWKSHYEPESNAVIIYMMDVSGSMSDLKKELVRLTAFWIDTWLRYQYRRVDIVYIAHDTRAVEVTEEQFYTLREAGGTKISSAYELCLKLIQERYPPCDWNVYPFHWTDGENWADNDKKCVELLGGSVLPLVNQFAYGEVNWSKAATRFSRALADVDDEEDKLVISKMSRKDHIYGVIKDFLGKGR